MLTFLIYVLIALLILGLIYYALGLLPVPQNVRVIVVLILALIVLLWIVQRAGLLP